MPSLKARINKADLAANQEKQTGYERIKTNVGSKFDDNYPVLMLPVRVETRFKEYTITNREHIKPEVIVINEKVPEILDRFKEAKDAVKSFDGEPKAMGEYMRILTEELRPVMDDLDHNLRAANRLVPTELERVEMEERQLNSQLERITNRMVDKEVKQLEKMDQVTKNTELKLDLIDEMKRSICGVLVAGSETSEGGQVVSDIVSRTILTLKELNGRGGMDDFDTFLETSNETNRELRKSIQELQKQEPVNVSIADELHDKEEELATEMSTLLRQEQQFISSMEDERQLMEDVSVELRQMERRLADEVGRKPDVLVDTPGEFEIPTRIRPVQIIKVDGGWTVTTETVRELWVRFYPDEVAIKTQEEKLTAEEEIDGQQYWMNTWHKPGNIEHDKGFWRGLVNGNGSKRASWIVKQTTPDNIEDANRPSLIPFSDPIGTALAAADLSVYAANAAIYWNAIWAANRSNSAEEAAWSNLVSNIYPTEINVAGTNIDAGDHLARLVLNAYWPTNFDVFTSPDYSTVGGVPEFPTAQEVAQIQAALVAEKQLTSFYISPEFPILTLKLSSWSNSAITEVMPDNFIVAAYDEDGTSTKWVGKRIASRLVTTVDPDITETKLSIERDEATGKIIFHDEIKWMVDFDKAEAIGMAMKIPLTNEQFNNGFKRLVVLGLKTDVSASQGQTLMEDLLENHHYSEEGMEVLPQGMPTNNTEADPSGYSTRDAGAEVSYQAERMDPLFTATSDVTSRKDGQWLAEALGIDPKIFEHTNNSDREDICTAMAMNQALFQGSLGNFLQVMLKEVFFTTDTSTINNLREFFTNYVSGRGFVPTIRVGEQPYGILVTSDYNNWLESDTSSAEGQIAEKVGEITRLLDKYWSSPVEADQVAHIEKKSRTVKESQANFTNILGLTASSSSYYVRYGLSDGPAGKLKYLLGDPFVPHPDPLVTVQGVEGLLDRYYWHSINALFSEIYPGVDRNALMFRSAFYNATDNLYPNESEDAPEEYSRGVVEDLEPDSQSPLQDFYDSPGKNYISHLLDTSNTDDYLLRLRSGLFDAALDATRRPKALLALYLRYSLMMQYFDSSMDILDSIKSFEITIRNTAPYGAQTASQADFFWVEFSKSFNARVLEYGAQISITNVGQHVDGLYPIAYVAKDKNGISSVMLVGPKLQAYKTSTRQERESKINDRIGKLETEFNRCERLKKSPNSPAFQLGIGEIFPKFGTLVRKNVGFIAHSNLDNLSSSDDSAGEIIQHWKFMLRDETGYVGRSDSDPISPAQYLVEELDTNRYQTQKKYLIDTRNALAKLEKKSTKELEMAFSEHTDLLSYRIDAWKQGLANRRLRKLRKSQATGVYVGAYGWVENLIPKSNVKAGEDKLPDGYSLSDNLILDEGNQGFIHAPSIPHANTAAVLRSAFSSNAEDNDEKRDLMSINLSSNRVKSALWLMEGIRNGQNIASLLGYRFERLLHDSPQQLDEYIFDIRKKYPLVMRDTAVTVAADEAIEARNVVHGLDLLTDAQATEEIADAYPFGLTLPAKTSDKGKAIIAAVESIADALDAVSDLAMAEGVFQISSGNYERGRAVLDAISNFGRMPEPDVIKTPRTGQAITSRVGVVFDTDTSDTNFTVPKNARALADPYLNHWLSGIFGDLGNVRMQASYVDAANATHNVEVSLADLELDAIDLLTVFTPELFNDEKGINLLIRNFLLTTANPAPGPEPEFSFDFVTVETGYVASGILTFSEFAPLLERTNEMLNNARALNDEDFIPAADNLQTGNNPRNIDVDDLYARVQVALNTGDTAKGIVSLQEIYDVLDPFIMEKLGAFTDERFDTSLIALPKAFEYGITEAIPLVLVNNGASDLKAMFAQISVVHNEIQKRLAEATELIADITPSGAPELEGDKKARKLEDASKAIFGRQFRITPLFNISNHTDVSTAYSRSTSIMSYANSMSDFPIDDWLLKVSHVRTNVRESELMRAILESFGGEIEYTPMQLPLESSSLNFDSNTNSYEEHWVGGAFPSSYDVVEDKISLALAFEQTDFTVSQAGLVIDQWVERLPSREEDTGLAFHYDQPNAKAPQALLLAVAPELTGKWDLDTLFTIVGNTLDESKKRAVEPDHLDRQKIAHLLPAIMTWTDNNHRQITLDPGCNTGNTIYPEVDYVENGAIKDYETTSPEENDVKPISYTAKLAVDDNQEA